MTIYSPINWVNDSVPAINASALNHMDAGIQSAHTELASQTVLLASTIGFASDIAGNIGANASSIAAQASTIALQGAALGSLVAADAALATAFGNQAAAVASSSAAVASILPAVVAQGSQLAAHATTLADHTSQLAAHATTLGEHGTSIGQLVATQTAIASTVSLVGPVASTVEAIGSALAITAAQATGITALRAAVPYMVRGGRGPVDLYSVDSNSPLLFAPGAIAVGQAVVPDQDWVVGQFVIDLQDNSSVPTAPGQFSFGVLNSVGSVIAWSVPTTVPTIIGAAAPAVSVPALPSGIVMEAGELYHLVVATDDEFKFSPYIKYAAAGPLLWKRGLAHEWQMPSGINLASYGSRPLSQASSVSPGNGLPAYFVS